MARVFSKRDKELRKAAIKADIERYKPKEKRSLGKYQCPVDVVGLVEDIQKLEIALASLETVDLWNITDSETQAQRDFGRDMLRSTITLIQTWRRYARLRLRRDFLKHL